MTPVLYVSLELQLIYMVMLFYTVERQADSFEQTKSNNVSLHEQLSAAKSHSEVVSNELAEKSDELTQLGKRYQQEEESHSKKVYKFLFSLKLHTFPFFII